MVATPVPGASGANLAVFDLTLVADGDIGGPFPHGLGFTPDHAVVTMQAAAGYIGQISVPLALADAVNFLVVKTPGPGSGGPNVARVEIGRNHSIIK
jgi:hypothetical protein